MLSAASLVKVVAAMCLNLSQPADIKVLCIDYWTNCAYDNTKEVCLKKEPKWSKIQTKP